MHKSSIVLSLLFLSSIALSQNIKMTTEYIQSEELQDVLMFEGIEYFTIQFTGDSLIGRDIMLVSKEIWNGDITEIDTIVNSAQNKYVTKLDTDTFRIKVLSKRTDDNFLKFHFPNY